jgi:tRNA threonylcarbamoyladenosine biosynthesis protein TsaE
MTPAVPRTPAAGPGTPAATMLSGVPVVLTVPTAQAMRELGHRLAKVLRAGDLLVLSGDLGAGKTTLVQGLGHALRVRGEVTSPTFVIARVHPSTVRGPALVHVDAYRLGSLAEVDDLDLDTAMEESVTVVEWGAGLVEGLAEDRLELTLHRPRGQDAADDTTAVGTDGSAPAPPVNADQPRTVELTGVGSRWAGVRLPGM